MPTNSDIYAAIVQIEERLRKSLDESRREKIAALIRYAKLSTDTTVARIAWAIQTVDEQFDEEFAKIKQEFETRTTPLSDVPNTSAFPDYDSPVIVGAVGDWRYNDSP